MKSRFLLQIFVVTFRYKFWATLWMPCSSWLRLLAVIFTIYEDHCLPCSSSSFFSWSCVLSSSFFSFSRFSTVFLITINSSSASVRSCWRASCFSSKVLLSSTEAWSFLFTSESSSACNTWCEQRELKTLQLDFINYTDKIKSLSWREPKSQVSSKRHQVNKGIVSSVWLINPTVVLTTGGKC